LVSCTDEEESTFKGGEEDSYRFPVRLLRQNELLESTETEKGAWLASQVCPGQRGGGGGGGGGTWMLQAVTDALTDNSTLRMRVRVCVCCVSLSAHTLVVSERQHYTESLSSTKHLKL
jgi:hypothetical protein